MASFTAVYEEDGDWIMAYLEELPGVNTQGRTKEEARANLRDALNEFLEGNRELARRGIAGRDGVVEEPFDLVERAA
jgi:predicted RNase H-like HicB family nuclease